LLVGGVLILAATRPDTFRVQRTAIVQAPADKIYPLISDLRQFNTWNPLREEGSEQSSAHTVALRPRRRSLRIQGQQGRRQGRDQDHQRDAESCGWTS
jgi:hypothetical protein